MTDLSSIWFILKIQQLLCLVCRCGWLVSERALNSAAYELALIFQQPHTNRFFKFHGLYSIGGIGDASRALEFQPFKREEFSERGGVSGRGGCKWISDQHASSSLLHSVPKFGFLCRTCPMLTLYLHVIPNPQICKALPLSCLPEKTVPLVIR